MSKQNNQKSHPENGNAGNVQQKQGNPNQAQGKQKKGNDELAHLLKYYRDAGYDFVNICLDRIDYPVKLALHECWIPARAIVISDTDDAVECRYAYQQGVSKIRIQNVSVAGVDKDKMSAGAFENNVKCHFGDEVAYIEKYHSQNKNIAQDTRQEIFETILRYLCDDNLHPYFGIKKDDREMSEIIKDRFVFIPMAHVVPVSELFAVADKTAPVIAYQKKTQYDYSAKLTLDNAHVLRSAALNVGHIAMVWPEKSELVIHDPEIIAMIQTAKKAKKET